MAAPELIEPVGDVYPKQKEGYLTNSYYYTVALDAQDGESRFFSPELLPYNRQLLGGKGTNLLTLTEIANIRPNIHVPPGFIISTEAWAESREIGYDIPDDVWVEALLQLADLEHKTGCRFGDPTNPLIVSARSGAEKSMPGMLDTVINIGLNDETVVGLGQQIGPSAAWESYYKLVVDLGKSAFNIDPAIFAGVAQQLLKEYNAKRLNQLSPTILQQLVAQAKEIIAQEGFLFPEDPYDQLQQAIAAVFASWDKQKAVDYRNRVGIADDLGTAVTIQQVVFGNSDKEGAGSGVLETRDSRTLGPAKTTFAEREQGTAVVSDAVHPELGIYDLPFPDHVIKEIETMVCSIEPTKSFPQQLEYTFDGEKFWLLQIREMELEPLAHFRRLLEISGITRDSELAMITVDEAIRFIPTAKLQSLLQPGLDPEAVKAAEEAGRILGTGIPISLGHATAPVIHHKGQALSENGQEYVLVSSLTTQRLTGLPRNVVAYITEDGSIGSHNASTARLIASERGIPIIFGAKTANIQEGQIVTVDGTSGKIFAGTIPVSEDGSGALTPTEKAAAERWLQAKCSNLWFYTYASWAGQPPDLDPALKTIERAGVELKSRKALETVAVQALIPAEIRMDYQVVKPDEEDKIRILVEVGNDCATFSPPGLRAPGAGGASQNRP